jgi:hypothetical protein
VCAAAPEHVLPAAPPPAHWREPPPRSSPAPDHVFPSSIGCVPLLLQKAAAAVLACSAPLGVSPPCARRERLGRRTLMGRSLRTPPPSRAEGVKNRVAFGGRGWRCRARMSPTVLSHTLLRGGEGLNDFTSREENGGNASSLMPQTGSVGLLVSDLIKLHCCSQSSG